jgi:protein SPA2
MEEQTGSMRNLQRELEELKETRMREQDSATRRARQNEDELQDLRNRCRQLEDEQMDKRAVNLLFPSCSILISMLQPDPEVVEQLQGDMQSLLAELSDLSSHNEDLMAAKDLDLNTISELEKQFKEYKRKYEQARAELRSVKGTFIVFAF